jgi:hypothetical protein
MELTALDPKLVLQVYDDNRILPAWDNFMSARQELEPYHMKYVHRRDLETDATCSLVVFETEADKLEFLMTWS